MSYATPRFQRFERVRIISHRHCKNAAGAVGATIWADLGLKPKKWTYIVELATPLSSQQRFLTCWEEELVSLGSIGSLEEHLGTHDEISFDVVSGREGCLRRKGGFWECYFLVNEDVEKLYRRESLWRSGIIVPEEKIKAPYEREKVWRTGIIGHHFGVPRDCEINERFVVEAISLTLEMKLPAIVFGPDSLVLK